jgi:hypothetical protein
MLLIRVMNKIRPVSAVQVSIALLRNLRIAIVRNQQMEEGSYRITARMETVNIWNSDVRMLVPIPVKMTGSVLLSFVQNPARGIAIHPANV